jgi:hypothetical protein
MAMMLDKEVEFSVPDAVERMKKEVAARLRNRLYGELRTAAQKAFAAARYAAGGRANFEALEEAFAPLLNAGHEIKIEEEQK